MNHDIKIIRELTEQYAALALSDSNAETVRLHRSLNNLRPKRPVLLIGEIPWDETNIDGELTLQCEDKDFRKLEGRLRRTLLQCRHVPWDNALTPYIGIQKIVHSSGIGVNVTFKEPGAQPGILAQQYNNQLNADNDLQNLHEPVITYDELETMRVYEKISNAIGDIVQVKLTGISTGYALGCITWDIIAQFMGVDDLLYNLLDRPEFIHKIVTKLTDIFLSTVRQYEDLNLFDGDALYCHCSAASCDDLEQAKGGKVTARNVWGRGLAQILATVSPAMHDEFDITYMKKAMEPFGLVYYGCCEPLDKKIDIVEKIPRLRKISITPWADVNVAAEAMRGKYVMSAKANPSNLAVTSLDRDTIRMEITSIIDACSRNGTPCEILLKDITTVNGNPRNLVEWANISHDIVRHC